MNTWKLCNPRMRSNGNGSEWDLYKNGAYLATGDYNDLVAMIRRQKESGDVITEDHTPGQERTRQEGL